MTSNSTEQPDGRTDRSLAEALARRFQGGEEGAFDELVRAVGRDVFNLAYRMTGSREDADDLAQEVFVKVHRSIGAFAWRSSFSTWLFTLVVNTCRSGLRRTRRISRIEGPSLDATGEDGRTPAANEPVDPADTPDRRLARAEVHAQVQRAIEALPVEFREAVLLRDVRDMAYEEIAEALDCSIGTVKSRIARGRLRLRELLAGVVDANGAGE